MGLEPHRIKTGSRIHHSAERQVEIAQNLTRVSGWEYGFVLKTVFFEYWLMETEPARQMGILHCISQAAMWSQAHKHRDKGNHHIFTRAENTELKFSPTLLFLFSVLVYVGWLRFTGISKNQKGASSNTIVYLKQNKKENLLSSRKKISFLHKK